LPGAAAKNRALMYQLDNQELKLQRDKLPRRTGKVDCRALRIRQKRRRAPLI
jgi:hypothetical protein